MAKLSKNLEEIVERESKNSEEIENRLSLLSPKDGDVLLVYGKTMPEAVATARYIGNSGMLDKGVVLFPYCEKAPLLDLKNAPEELKDAIRDKLA